MCVTDSFSFGIDDLINDTDLSVDLCCSSLVLEQLRPDATVELVLLVHTWFSDASWTHGRTQTVQETEEQTQQQVQQKSEQSVLWVSE